MRRIFAALLCAALLLGTIPTTAETAGDPFLRLENTETVLTLQQTECKQKGTVEVLSYECPAYAINEVLGMNVTIEKTVSVYLPYGYDPAKQYNVLYLLHGTGGDDQYWLLKAKTGVPTVNLLDNLIQQGLCDPLIVVAPNWNADKKGKQYKPSDEQAAAYGELVQDPNIKVRNDLWVAFFQEELRNDIIPLVESKYATFAGGDVSGESLVASRDHRALAGLSRGSTATLRAGVIANHDIFSWIGAFSGAWVRADQFEESLKQEQYPIHFWYNGNGTEDFSLEEHQAFLDQVRGDLPGMFNEGVNYAFVVKEGSAHAYENWITDLYNILQVFFR